MSSQATVGPSEDRKVTLTSCRQCSSKFQYELRSGEKATIIIGIPPSGIEYKAISFVWGDVHPLPVDCLGCGETSYVLVSDASKLRRLMELVGPANAWLDIMSIDQDDEQDKATQIAAMGNIYSKASCVSVLLPTSDALAHHTLWSLYLAATILLRHYGNFRNNTEEVVAYKAKLGHWCAAFFHQLLVFEEKLHQWVYWKRAWTFQEWSLAQDVEITWEEATAFDMVPLRYLKSSIFSAAVMLANFKLQNGQYCNINFGFSRGQVQRRFDTVKRLFPYVDYLLSSEEIDQKLAIEQVISPSIEGTDHMLGLRISKNRSLIRQVLDIEVDESSKKTDRFRVTISSMQSPQESGFVRPVSSGLGLGIRPHQRKDWEFTATQLSHGETLVGCRLRPGGKKPGDSSRNTEDERFYARLSIMLNSFGISERDARFQADKICCWASMCNIRYDYQKDDPFAVALQKVLKVLRRRGSKIYSFHVNTRSLDVDVQFLKYASEHQLCNATSRTYLHCAPIFNGRADTAVHLRASIMQSLDTTLLSRRVETLRKLDISKIKAVTSLTNIPEFLSEFSLAVIGKPEESDLSSLILDVDMSELGDRKAENMAWAPLLGRVRAVLESIPREHLVKSRLVTASWVQVEQTRTPAGRYMYIGWAICPANIQFKDLFVGRESLNGTLILAYQKGQAFHAVAYITLTYERSGTYLIETDENGRVEMLLQTPQRSDILSAHYSTGGGIFQGIIPLQREQLGPVLGLA